MSNTYQRNVRHLMSKCAMLLLSALVVAFAGCQDKPSPYQQFATAHNTVRKQLGIPVIPESWTVEYAPFHFDALNPQRSQTTPCRFSKRVGFSQAGLPEYEEDVFYSGKSVVHPADGPMQEMLIVTYAYSSHKPYRGSWRIDGYLTKPSAQAAGLGTSGSAVSLTRTQATAVLRH